jgi:hypothetical protein
VCGQVVTFVFASVEKVTADQQLTPDERNELLMLALVFRTSTNIGDVRIP